MPGRARDEGPGALDLPVPAGATKPQFRRMIQALLEERFRLQMYSEKKDGASVYELVVAKNGPKLTEAKPRARRGDPEARRSAAAG